MFIAVEPCHSVPNAVLHRVTPTNWEYTCSFCHDDTYLHMWSHAELKVHFKVSTKPHLASQQLLSKKLDCSVTRYESNAGGFVTIPQI